MLRRLHPEPGSVAVADAISQMGLGALAPERRPYVIANMVASADGRATLAGRSGGLGNAADREIFHRLRTQADAVLVGTGTLRTERYGPMIRRPELREARVREGLAPDPLAVTIARSHRLPLDIPLFQDAGSRIAVFTSTAVPVEECPARVDVTRLAQADLTPGGVLERLRADHGVRSVLCEGGPTLLHALVAGGLLDELFLCVSPQLAGGDHALSILSGPQLAEPMRLRLGSVLESEDHLFLRYVRAASG